VGDGIVGTGIVGTVGTGALGDEGPVGLGPVGGGGLGVGLGPVGEGPVGTGPTEGGVLPAGRVEAVAQASSWLYVQVGGAEHAELQEGGEVPHHSQAEPDVESATQVAQVEWLKQVEATLHGRALKLV